MGVYIKAMDLTEIEKLVLMKNVQMIFSWTSDMKLTAITKTESDSGIVSYSKEFDVVEIPEPHGRLADIEDVKKAIFDYHEEDEQKVRTMINAILSSVPTVIEADGE